MQFIDVMRSLVHDNKYSRTYFNIVVNARTRAVKRSSAKRLLGYVEGHHIVPQSIRPDLKSERGNIAFLTSREHFICHLLLTKCMINSDHARSMAFAFFKMFNVNPNQTGNRYVNSRFYAYANSLNSDACVERNSKRVYAKGYSRPLSDETKAKIGLANSDTTAYHNAQTGDTIFVANGEGVPEGFVKGGNPNFTKASTKTFGGTAYAHNPLTGDEVRVKGQIPDGYVEGRCYAFITNGVDTQQVNTVTGIIPDGWYLGRTLGSTKDVRRGNSGKTVKTPFGEFRHKLDFCEQYDVDVTFFDNLDSRIRRRPSNQKLVEALLGAGLQLTMTKAEMGFSLD